MHIHVGVDNLAASIQFYSTLFDAEPTVAKDDYAKWMLDDPRVNFAISSEDHATKGIEHLGIQAENPEELQQVFTRLRKADAPVLEEGQTTCCYAQSEKAGSPIPTASFGKPFTPTVNPSSMAIRPNCLPCRAMPPKAAAARLRKPPCHERQGL
ncbi:VOC family protein [Sphingopyxis sp. BSNA05]|uniref:VOC family protein n=1 Tax=Sphingopyxis sp. BSNA05 TaxID=1236614 RepID=UPI00349F57CC